MEKIKIAIVGVGNCASSLVQGIEYYKEQNPEEAIGLMHWEIGGYKPYDIEVVAAFDIDDRKVGTDIADAIFAPPNCTTIFCENLPKTGAVVSMGKVLDGFSDHMKNYDDNNTFVLSSEAEPTKEEVVEILLAALFQAPPTTALSNGKYLFRFPIFKYVWTSIRISFTPSWIEANKYPF